MSVNLCGKSFNLGDYLSIDIKGEKYCKLGFLFRINETSIDFLELDSDYEVIYGGEMYRIDKDKITSACMHGKVKYGG